ncbi:YraN family protein [Patescibacteria group bacterium]|nr:YraN family protein [Patescibacteria group bacterium]MBU1028707.1 YraN family protein [Patescibacteria group bacterium]
MPSAALGLKGERAAARYLKKNGYKILARRWKCRFGELDLVAKQGDEVVFIEVKTRATDNFGGAISAVGWHKAIRLRAAAHSYLSVNNLLAVPFRIDVIAITVCSGGRATLEHFFNAITEGD